MTSKFKSLSSKPPTPRRAWESIRDAYSNVDAAVGISKAAYTLGKLGPVGAATAVLDSLKEETEVARLKARLAEVEEELATMKDKAIQMEEGQNKISEDVLKFKEDLDKLKKDHEEMKNQTMKETQKKNPVKK